MNGFADPPPAAIIESCHFPRLYDGVPCNNAVSVSIFTLTAALGDVQDFCVQYDLTMPCLFQAAWATVLRTYVTTNNPNFGYKQNPTDNKNDIIFTLAFDIDAHVSAGQLLKQVKAKTKEELPRIQPAESAPFNTILEYGEHAAPDVWQDLEKVSIVSAYLMCAYSSSILHI